MRCLWVVRNPIDVVRSLAARDKFSTEASLGIWLNHNLLIWAHTRVLPVAVVSYEQMLQDWRRSLERCAAVLPSAPSAVSAETAAAIDQALRKDLCHSSSTLADLHASSYPPEVVELAEMLATFAEAGIERDGALGERMDALWSKHVESARLYRHKGTRRNKELTRLRASENSLRSSVSQVESRLARTRAEADSLRATIRDLYASGSWRITGPLRGAVEAVGVVSRLLSRPSEPSPSSAEPAVRVVSSPAGPPPSVDEIEVPATRLPVKAIAFYLPQFHPTAENDAWWGPGFTEWRNVAGANAFFEGHYQPHVPSDLGYYDLRVSEVREQQAEMAAAYGVHGFCYHHYWFSGRRLLERPLDEVLRSGRPNFPFCISWANEHWTRTWDGHPGQILLRQEHSLEDSQRFIEHLLPALRDERYIRVNGKAVLLVYQPELIPDCADTADMWREICHKEGVGELLLCAAQTFDTQHPERYGFDSAVEYPPHGAGSAHIPSSPEFLQNGFQGDLFDYAKLVSQAINRPDPSFPLLRGVMPSWDNTARKGKDGSIWLHSSPELYETWLRAVGAQAATKPREEDRLVFINAWNEWAEGCHLEPCRQHGHGYLEATRSALAPFQSAAVASPKDGGAARKKRIHLHVGYHKTGTTSIQVALAQSVVDGLLYPRAGRTADLLAAGHPLLAWAARGCNAPMFPARGQKSNEELFSGVWSDLRAEVSASAKESALISSECFDTLSTEHIHTVGKELAGFEVAPILFVRNYADIVEGSYRTRIVHFKEHRPIERFLAEYGTRLDFPGLVRDWQRIAYNGRVRVISYEDPAVRGDSLQALLGAIGLPTPSYRAPRENTGVPAFLCELVRARNAAGDDPDKTAAWLAEQLLDLPVASLATLNRQYTLVPPGLRAELATLFADHIEEFTKMGVPVSGLLQPAPTGSTPIYVADPAQASALLTKFAGRVG